MCAEIERAAPARIGLTGGGAPALESRLAGGVTPKTVDEFRAWGAGAGVLVREQGGRVEGRYLLVSLGTGTSVLLVEGERVARVGGTALGGGTVVGLGAALHGALTFRQGRVQESNFHDYRILRQNEMPTVETHIVPSGAAPSGVGEPGTPPIAPAVANALFALTGQRVRELPIRLRA